MSRKRRKMPKGCRTVIIAPNGTSYTAFARMSDGWEHVRDYPSLSSACNDWPDAVIQKTELGTLAFVHREEGEDDGGVPANLPRVPANPAGV